MAGLPWILPWPWGYLFGGPAQYGAVIFGLLLVLIGVVYLPVGLVGGANGALRAVTRLVPARLTGGLCGGLLVGMALSLAAGLLLALAPLHVGRVVPPYNLSIGLAMGLGCGIVFGWAGGWAARMPRGLLVGSACGLVIGLGTFQVAFGPTAGFGPETDVGVGTEVGLAFGLVGGLAGALVGVLVGRRGRPEQASGVDAPRRGWTLIGAAIGAASGLVIGVVGWLTNVFPMMLPYYGGITDCSYPQTCGSQLSPTAMQVLGVAYELGLFVLSGALIGALAGALAGQAQPSDGDGRTSRWAALALAAGLVAGLAAGLATVLRHQLIGGPAPIMREGFAIDANPQAGMFGLAGGLVCGVALGVVGALVFRWALRQPGRSLVVIGAILIVLGIVAWTLPSWFFSPIAIDIP